MTYTLLRKRLNGLAEQILKVKGSKMLEILEEMFYIAQDLDEMEKDLLD